VRRTRIELAAIILGLLFVAIGGLLVVFPSAQMIPHHDPETGKYSLERVSEKGSRIYGSIAVILGAGFVWFGRWPGGGAKSSAIERYVWELSQELARRFGVKRHYAIDEVTRSAQRGSFDTRFIAHAHAIFCSRAEFDGHYKSTDAAGGYNDLRSVVSRRYFGGDLDFDAANVVRATKKPNKGDYDFAENDLA
jgi:hypothetical protein